jgi:hypothetical protein
VIADDLIEHPLPRAARFVARRGRGHPRPEGGSRTKEKPDTIGLQPRACERKVVDFAVLSVGCDRRSCGGVGPSDASLWMIVS